MIESFEFKGPEAGPAVLFFGAIHGNEVCGPKAIRRFVDELQSGVRSLQKGSVTFVPVCSPRAYEANTRYCEENLNRIFKRTENPTSYEAALANELAPFIERCDVFLDLHSMTASGKPFIFIDFPSDATHALARSLPAEMAIVGWPELYKRPETEHDSFDTTTYAAEHGKAGLLIECGQHEDPEAAEVAYRAIENTLIHCGVLLGNAPENDLTIIEMDRVFFRKSEAEKFAKDWQHLEHVNKDEILFYDENGAPVTAPYDAYVIMPKESAKVDEEWLYLGKKISA
ncbi:MAG: succinylglutamate desuccinylase/aspartoacylase family protein [Candidatus Kaiserbacteria bacterium]|nr:succinylglutamate desuccinylase/aspartoacylase family protein [Candidatus Kaiserbacteria bacterium]